jgi:hypothetical protein
MEKFFVIDKESSLYKDYFKWKQDAADNAKIFDEFSKTLGIEANSYLPRKGKLYIVPTENDLNKFKNQFTQGDFDNGIRQFKCNSIIGKAWANVSKDISEPCKPNYFGLVRIYGRYYERMFAINDVLYGSLSSSECNFELHECMKEIKASEFYKVIEEYKEKEDKNNE